MEHIPKVEAYTESLEGQLVAAEVQLQKLEDELMTSPESDNDLIRQNLKGRIAELKLKIMTPPEAPIPGSPAE